jgi:hypothetical protein
VIIEKITNSYFSFGSDANKDNQRNKAMKCKLCGKNNNLIKSHIIPEFFFKPAYDKLHRINIFSTNIKERNRYIQKGVREPLLCKKCEQLISPWEKYVREVFYGGVGIDIAFYENKILLSNINYNEFKLFSLSFIWRASVASDKFFSYINLGPHEEKVKRMILDQDPGKPHEYGCIIILLTLSNRVFDDFILQPDQLPVDGQNCIRFTLGGCLWLFNVSSHSNTFGGKPYFLQENGSLVIPKQSAENKELINKFAVKLKEAGKI